MKKSYSTKDLSIIKKRNPNLYMRIESVASRSMTIKQLMDTGDPDDFIHACTEIFDVCYKYPFLFSEIQKACKDYTGHGFFRKMVDYNDSWCKYQIVLSLFDDIEQMNS